MVPGGVQLSLSFIIKNAACSNWSCLRVLNNSFKRAAGFHCDATQFVLVMCASRRSSFAICGLCFKFLLKLTVVDLTCSAFAVGSIESSFPV